MKQKVRQVVRRVNYLKDATPLFVSLVDRGANETPFAALKTLSRETAVARKPKKAPEAPEKAAKRNDQNIAVYGLRFAKAAFPSETEVAAYLDGNDWTDYVIESSDDSFFAKAKEAKESGALREIEMEVGVTGVVYEEVPAAPDASESAASEDADTREEGPNAVDAEEAKKTSESVPPVVSPKKEGKSVAPLKEKTKKYWGYYAECSTSYSLSEVLMAGMTDGVPPGYEELEDAMSAAIANAHRHADNPAAAVDVILADFSRIVGSLYALFKGTTEAKRRVAPDETPKQSPASEAPMQELQEIKDALAAVAKSVETLGVKMAAVETAVGAANEKTSGLEASLKALENTAPEKKAKTPDFIRKQEASDDGVFGDEDDSVRRIKDRLGYMSLIAPKR
jgi:hypothetical protein